MNKKIYIKPNSKHTVIASASMIAGSDLDSDENTPGFGGGSGNENGEPIDVESKLFNWDNSFDEF